MLIPQNNLKGFDTSRLAIELVAVRKVEEAFRQLFGLGLHIFCRNIQTRLMILLTFRYIL